MKSTLLKDTNFLEMGSCLNAKKGHNQLANVKKHVVNIHCERSDKVLNIIEDDCEFLKENGLMDYSLLLIKEKVSDEQ